MRLFIRYSWTTPNSDTVQQKQGALPLVLVVDINLHPLLRFFQTTT